ncbi:mitochondrial carrier protein [Hirsutella rhossiliensis]|uniref:Mitochondrial glycine transporter n=1 Tax=Hirsutella rhossiliensis TaxID=111463 RepID=A0A9P8MUV5_9HYPO|nr:mitochondrial carrier protein [Hirsutella rhossiliensis]KAH0960671.1 mitochondrial carrier protein [Hirsutella rhossiliensis]
MNETRSPARAKPGLHFASGLGSGIASAVILQPLDFLKTRVQQTGRPSLSACLRDARRSSQLIRTLWRGTVPSALRTGFGSALYLTSLNAIRQHVQQMGDAEEWRRETGGSSALPDLTYTANLVSGAMARTIAGFCLMPLTVIKVRFESSLYSYPSMIAAAREIQRADGLRGFFSGFGATAIRDAPSAGMYVVIYESFKKRINSWVFTSYLDTGHATISGPVASSINFSSAIVAGAACSAISNPFDAIKTRIQLQPHQFRNIWQAASVMVAQDGFRSLWNGLALRMSRKALSSALAWTVYEELIRKSSVTA